MLKIRVFSFGNISKVVKNKYFFQQKREATALYVSGDKAKETTPPIHPFLDFEGTFSKRESVEDSIKHRKLSINFEDITAKYSVFQEFKKKIKDIEMQRMQIAETLKTLNKDSQDDKDRVATLRQQGKELRIKLKELKEEFYAIDDDFVHEFLKIPNVLHKQCPTNGHDRVIYVGEAKQKEEAESHMNRKNLFLLNDNDNYYMMEEAAIFDIDCTHAFTDHIVTKGDFIQSSNPDFARSVILEAIATPPGTYHDIIEKDLKNNLNKAHLVGGGAFESSLPEVARLCLYPSALPLKYAGFGRNYRISELRDIIKNPNLYTATQNNSVNTFVAAASEKEADLEMENILNLSIDFYKNLDIHFRIVYLDASKLTISECLRANIEVYSPAEKRYIMVGHISNYSDFLAKRLLFTFREGKQYKFPYIVGGPVVYVSRLIAALVENDLPLDSNKLLCHFEIPDLEDMPVEYTENPEDWTKNGIDIYKNAFK